MFDFTFYLPTRIHFGQGKLKEVGKIASSYGKRALIVTGRSSARKLGFLDIMEEELKKAKVETILFERVEPNPSVQTVEEGARIFKKTGCELIIALGGGSPLDAAKSIGTLAANPAPLDRYYGKNKIKKEIPPLIAIPTTAGTGSEVTPYAVITDTREGEHRKRIIADPHLFPREALIDPSLTFSLSPALTSDTGIDALSHAVESYISQRAFPFSEVIALEAVKILGNYLPEVFHNPRDEKIRSYLIYASTLAGIAIAQTGTTLLHAMGYRLTSDLGIPHGRANGILLPSFWEINFSGNPDKFAHLVSYLKKGLRESQKKDARESALVVEDFLYRAGLPSSLNIQVEEKSLFYFAREVAEDKTKLANNPRNIGLEEIICIYKKAFQSKLKV